MRVRRYMSGIVAVGFASLAVWPGPAFAQLSAAPAGGGPPTPSPALKPALERLKVIIANLGYTLDPGQALQITIGNDKYTYPIGFFLSNNDTVLSSYIILRVIPPEKLKNMPMCQLLYFNDTHMNFFSMNDRGTDKRIVINAQMLAADVSPQSMRIMIDGILADSNASDKIWNPNLWTGSTFPTNCAPP